MRYTDLQEQVHKDKHLYANYKASTIDFPQESVYRISTAQDDAHPSGSEPQKSKSRARQHRCRCPFRKCHRDNPRLAKTASRPARKELFVIGSQPISPPEGKGKTKKTT